MQRKSCKPNISRLLQTIGRICDRLHEHTWYWWAANDENQVLPGPNVSQIVHFGIWHFTYASKVIHTVYESPSTNDWKNLWLSTYKYMILQACIWLRLTENFLSLNSGSQKIVTIIFMPYLVLSIIMCRRLFPGLVQPEKMSGILNLSGNVWKVW